MNWFLALIGLLLGLAFAFFYNLPSWPIVIVYVGLGFLLGQSNRQGKGVTRSPDSDRQVSRVESGADFAMLVGRVRRLERNVARLEHVIRGRSEPDAGLPPSADSGSWRQAVQSGYRAVQPDVPAETAIAPSGVVHAMPVAGDSTATRASNAASAPITQNAGPTEIGPIPPSPPAEPHDPSPSERIVLACRDWLFGGDIVVRIGIIVLFFGIAYLLKYAADKGMFPIEFRLAGVAVAAMALLVSGWCMRERRFTYGLALQGGGVGILYLTILAATRLYQLVPLEVSFALMVAICGLSAFVAVRQNAQSLVFLGSAGGFLAPVLLSMGGENQVMLFGYYALLNAGIFAIAWFKDWRPLNLLGFAFTFVIGAAWGVMSYSPSMLATTEPFLILFFLMYVGISLLYAVLREIRLKHYVDGGLVFGTPLAVIILQGRLMQDTQFGLAWSAVALSAFYLAIAAALRGHRVRLGLLFDSMLVIAVLFATLAIPLAFSGLATSAVWAVEGAGIVWISARQRRQVPLFFGLLMQMLAAIAWAGLLGGVDPTHSGLPVLNSHYIGTLLLAIGGFVSSWCLHGRAATREWDDSLPQTGLLAAVWGLLWWFGGGLSEIFRYFSLPAFLEHQVLFEAYAAALFILGSGWLAHGLRRRLAWPLAELPALAVAPALAACMVACVHEAVAPSIGYGGGVWPMMIAGAYLLLWRQQRDVPERVLRPLHVLMFWTQGLLFALEIYWRLKGVAPASTWSWCAWAYGFGIAIVLVANPGVRALWPVRQYARAYLLYGATPLVALLWLWSLVSLASDGDPAPLFYLPIVNSLDIAQLLAFMAMAVWYRRVAELGVQWNRHIFLYSAWAITFLWINALLLRTLHHWVGVPYTPEGLWSSALVQGSLSAYWTAYALVAMVVATRRASRGLWFAGCALLGAAVVKLFLVDLSYVDGIARIVSFIGVGLMMLLIGYVSPLPPKPGRGQCTA